MHLQLMAAADRLWSSVEERESGCWEWTGRTVPEGYGQFQSGNVMYAPHRLAYAEVVGCIPAGLTIDHLCLNKRCCNPAHLEAVTRGENTRRAMYVRWAKWRAERGLLDKRSV